MGHRTASNGNESREFDSFDVSTSDAIRPRDDLRAWWRRVDEAALQPMNECQAKKIFEHVIKISRMMSKAGECLEAALIDDNINSDCADDASEDRRCRAQQPPRPPSRPPG